MFIKITHYGYFNKDGHIIYGLFCGYLPAKAIILEEREVLFPQDGYVLVNKITGEELTAVYLRDNDCEDNYTEKEIS